jgi:peptidoglycan biosynthesis protein MviN/MurJ (putative lipid II flippase)
VLAVVVNVAVSVTTFGSLGLSGLALGIAIGAWVEAVLLTVLLRERTAGVRLESLGRALAEFSVGALLAALAALSVVRVSEGLAGPDPGKVAILLQSAAAFAAASAVYLAYSRLLRVPELSSSIGILRQMMRRGDGEAA